MVDGSILQSVTVTLGSPVEATQLHSQRNEFPKRP